MKFNILQLLLFVLVVAIAVTVGNQVSFVTADISVFRIDDRFYDDGGLSNEECVVAFEIVERNNGMTYRAEAVASKSYNAFLQQKLDGNIDLNVSRTVRYRATQFLHLKPVEIEDLISPHFSQSCVTFIYDPTTRIETIVNVPPFE